jgi:mannitol-1-/sugar-/sorbitol-6-phosphatase
MWPPFRAVAGCPPSLRETKTIAFGSGDYEGVPLECASPLGGAVSRFRERLRTKSARFSIGPLRRRFGSIAPIWTGLCFLRRCRPFDSELFVSTSPDRPHHWAADARIDFVSNLVSMRCKAVLFDMDGTLVDSTQVVKRAWGGWAVRHNLPPQDVLSFSHGRPTRATLEHFLPGGDHSEELEELARFEETQTAGIRAVPGAAEVLHTLQNQNYPWAIVTSAWRKLTEIRVIAACLPLPRVIVPVDEIRNGKPDPEGFLRAAKQLGVAPAECIVFEDTRPGIDAGLGAGMDVVGLLTTYSARELRHLPLIGDFRDVAIRPEGEVLRIELSNQLQSAVERGSEASL